MFDLKNDPCPLIAILRGLTPEDVPMVGEVLFEAGFKLLEVPLNRSGALQAISALAKMAPDDVLIGGGTMLKRADVDAVKNAGGRFMVSPNCEPDVISHAASSGLLAFPGVATPTEAYRALDAGAHALKLFPAEMIPPSVVKAMRSILPQDVYLLPVGGIHQNNMAAYVDAGANGFGIGSQLYRPGMNREAVHRAAVSFMEARAGLIQKP